MRIAFSRAAMISLLPSLCLLCTPGVKAQVSLSDARPIADPQRMRANDLLALLKGEGAVSAIFHSAFLAEIPEIKLRALLANLSDHYGAPKTVRSIERLNSAQSVVIIEYDKAAVRFEMTIAAPSEQSQITGLFITKSEVRGDTLGKVTAEIAALPGVSAVGIWHVTPQGMVPLAGHQPGRIMAVGSSFKLSILAALDNEIRSGRRKWSDVVPLTHKSLPSGQLQHWPNRAPLTLHTLATLMISVSDNSATDTLLHLFGRDTVTGFEKAHGIAVDRRYPLLSTLEAFVLKEPAQANLLSLWNKGNYEDRSRFLAKHQASWTLANTGNAMMQAKPRSIETVEWFYTPEDMAKLLVWFATSASKEANAILSVAPGLPAADRKGWTRVGYKGGSEPGVIALNYLLTRTDGTYYIIAAAWNNPSQAVDEQRFYRLIARIIGLLPQSRPVNSVLR